MKASHSHFLLFSEATPDGAAARDQWRFVLQSLDHRRTFSASDHEPDSTAERLELLAVVRGLEAIPEPSRVTLVTRSRYVSQGITRALDEWRENGWRWERFGRLVSVRDSDLWRRVDRALQFHDVECRAWRFDARPESELFAEEGLEPAHDAMTRPAASPAEPAYEPRRLPAFRPAPEPWREGLVAALSAPWHWLKERFRPPQPSTTWAGTHAA